eukprot:scaffold87052_cov81-Phaeocystis_antarctica.AAC.1
MRTASRLGEAAAKLRACACGDVWPYGRVASPFLANTDVRSILRGRLSAGLPTALLARGGLLVAQALVVVGQHAAHEAHILAGLLHQSLRVPLHLVAPLAVLADHPVVSYPHPLDEALRIERDAERRTDLAQVALERLESRHAVEPQQLPRVVRGRQKVGLADPVL